MADGILNPIEQLEAEFDFDVYTKQEVDALLDEKADKSDTYTKTETDALLDEKADADAVYTKTETDTLLSAKADKSTTLAGYGITDAYTKTQTDNLLNGKADADSVYTKTEINTKIPNTVGSATKPTYVNGGVITECTYELNKTVPANAVFTDTTYSAGNGLNLSGTSFSAKAGVNVSVDGNGINVNGNGAVASADSGLVSGGTAYTELRPTLDGTWVKNAQTTAINLQKLEGGIEYLYAILSKQYDQLKKYINGNYYDYDTDANSKYTKSVPQGAMPYASLDSIGGKTVVWNQLVQNGNFADGTSGWSTPVTNPVLSASDGVLTVTAQNAPTAFYGLSVSLPSISHIKDHKILVTAEFYSPYSVDMGIFNNIVFGGYKQLVANTGTNTWVKGSMITTVANSYTGSSYFASYSGYSSFQAGDSFKIRNVMIHDLTLLYGAGNEPSTVAEFQQTFPAVWYAYSKGQLLSAGVTSVISKKADTTEIATYSIPAEVQALEGYGLSAGSVYNYIDYERKKFVQNVARVDLGTLVWGSSSSSGKKYFFSSSLSSDIKYVAGYNNVVNNIIYPYGSAGTFFNAYNGAFDCIAVGGQGVNEGRIAIYDSTKEEMTNAEFKESVSGVYAYYELATPQEIDISEYLTDDNLIEVEAGGTLTFPNSNGTDYQIPVPSAETYMVDLQEAI